MSRAGSVHPLLGRSYFWYDQTLMLYPIVISVAMTLPPCVFGLAVQILLTWHFLTHYLFTVREESC